MLYASFPALRNAGNVEKKIYNTAAAKKLGEGAKQEKDIKDSKQSGCPPLEENAGQLQKNEEERI